MTLAGYVEPAGRMRPVRRFCDVQLRLSLEYKYKRTACPYFENLKFTFLLQVILSLSRLYCVLGDFRMSTDTLVQSFLLVFRFLPLFRCHWTCLWNHIYRVVKGAKQWPLPLQLGFERFQYIRL